MNRDIERARALYKIASGPGAMGMNPAQYRDFRQARRDAGNLPPAKDLRGNPIPRNPIDRRGMSPSEAIEANRQINENQKPSFNPFNPYRSAVGVLDLINGQRPLGTPPPGYDYAANGRFTPVKRYQLPSQGQQQQ